MSRITRVVVLVTALMSLFAVLSSAAGATGWDNSGSTSFTATGGPGTLSVGANALTCADSGTTGTSPTSSATGDLVTGTATFTGCTLGGVPAHMSCTYTLTATGQAGGVTSVTIDATCDAFVFASAACHVRGTTHGTYTNPVGTTKGKLTLAHSSGTLTVFNAPGATCLLGNNVGATLTAQTLTITTALGGTGTLGPVITRTP